MFKKHDKEDKHEKEEKKDKKKDKHDKDKDKEEEKREKKDKHASMVVESPQKAAGLPTSQSSMQLSPQPITVASPSGNISKAPSTPAVDQSQSEAAAAAAAAAAAEQKKKEEERKRREKEAADEERKKKELQDREAEEKAKRRDERKRKEREEAEAQRQRDIVSSQQQADDEGNEEAEAQSLEAVKQDPTESHNIFKEIYDIFPSEVFSAYDQLQSFARELNTQIPVLEVVMVGPRGCGKSTLIEAIIGRPSNAVGSGGITKRPLFLQFINNQEVTSEAPKITIKRDSSIKEFDHDVSDVSLDSLPSVLSSRNKVYTEEPIFVQYEHKEAINMTIIDTPGLLLGNKSTDANQNDSAKIDEIVTKVTKPQHRIILAVENASDWSSSDLPSFLKKIDPELSRTTFVYTKFYSHLQDVNNTRAVNRFLSGTQPDVKTFFTTMPSFKIRAKFGEADKFQQKIWQSYRRDMIYLEQLQYDKRYEKSVGVHALRRWILNQAWKNYQESIPRILKHLRSKRSSSESKLRDVDAQIDSLNAGRLRGIASNYVVTFLQILEQLLQGTVEGQPTINGQTLEEEKQAHGDGDWYGSNNRPIKFDPSAWEVLYWDSKLYGGQQFERLLSEFKAVADHTDITEVTMDDVATAAGVNKLNNIPNYAWAASDLAGQKSQEALGPLIDQLCDRSVYIMKRLTDVADKIVESRKKKWQSSYRTGVNMTPSSHHIAKANDVSNIEQYPYFTHHVKDLYFKFVDKTAEKCKKKCMSEFLETRTIYWDYTENPDATQVPIDRASMSIEDTRATVFNLSKTMFTSLRNRIVRNVLLKFYNFFLVPIQNDLWVDIQGKVNSLSDANLEQIFEISATKDKLIEDKKHLESVVKKSIEQDSSLLDASTHFCHPIIMNQLGTSTSD